MRRGGTVGLDTALQATRSRVRFSIGSLRFFVELNFRRNMALGPTQCLTETYVRNISLG